MKDDLGDRMKRQYESRTQTYLPRRTYTVLRLDGRTFHTFTRKHQCEKPYDSRLMKAMDSAACHLCANIQGAVLGYVQSDEISLLLTDFASITTAAWFDGNVQKIVSLGASMVTVYFNQAFASIEATFDARVFTIPDPTEVYNYFVWRQKDAVRNSIQMAAQAHFSHHELEGKSGDALQEMLFQEKGINWAHYPPAAKNGRIILRYATSPVGAGSETLTAERHEWSSFPAPIFMQDSEYLQERIPRYP